MDQLDTKIVAELDKNPRLPLSQLAKKARLSQQVTDYRVKRMLNEGLILKFTPIINLKSLGLEHYRIFFTFNAKKGITNETIFSYLQDKKGIYWTARIGGKYDLIVVLWVKDFAHFDTFIDEFNNHFPGLIKDYKSCYAIDHQIHKHKFISKDYTTISYGYDEPLVDLDDLDHYILQAIKDNCRKSALEISRGKDISYKTIINRIKNLEEKRVILGYRMFLRSIEEVQQRAYIVLFSFKNYRKNIEQDLLGYVQRLDSVTQTIRLFGIWNLFIHVRVENNEKLQNIVIEIRDKFEIIDEYEIIPVFEDIAINLMPV